MDLIQEAKKRGYRKGVSIRYVPHAIDQVEGDYFEINKGDLIAFKKPKNERISFEDFTFDTLYDGITKQWVEIVKKN